METIRVTRGLDIPLAGRPAETIDDAAAVSRVALLGGDYPGVRPRLLVAEGDRVAIGQPLYVDKHNPAIRFASPGTGVVDAIRRGPRRALVSISVALVDSGGDEPAYEPMSRHLLATLDGETVRERLTETGLWTALRARPFGVVPDPGTAPFALFVTAIDTEPLAPEPRVVIDTDPRAFRDGLAVLAMLTDGAVYVCVAPGHEPDVPDDERIRTVAFSGPHPAGLPGTHMHLLSPVGQSRTAWVVGYQDVMAVGTLFATGRLDMTRIVALTGPRVHRPRLLRTRVGAAIGDLIRDELSSGETRIVSGSVLAGRRAIGDSAFLGRYHTQVCALTEGQPREFLGWLRPGRERFSAVRAFLSGLMPRRPMSLTTSQNGSPRAMVPIGNFEPVMPLDVLPAPLLKALVVGDLDSAIDLGCLELVEEDLALLSFVDVGKYDYGPVLRDALDAIRGSLT